MRYHYIKRCLCWEEPGNTPSVDDSKEGLAGLSTQSYSWLSVVDCSEKISSKISKGKGRVGEGWEKLAKWRVCKVQELLNLSSKELR